MKTLSLPLLLTGSALLLASCNNDPAPQPVNEITVAGQVRQLDFDLGTGKYTYPAWNGGAGKINVAARSKPNFAQGTLNADGSFSVLLPKPDASLLTEDVAKALVAEALPADCISKLTITGAADARAVGVSFSAQAGKSGRIVPASYTVDAADFRIESGGYVYYDKATILNGQVACIMDGISISGNINMQFNPGWNKVHARITTTKTLISVTMTTGSVPSSWVLLDDQTTTWRSSLSGQALSPLNIPFLR